MSASPGSLPPGDRPAEEPHRDGSGRADPFDAGAPPSAGEVCTTSEAAQLLGVSHTTVQALATRGELRAWRTAGGHRRISRASVDALRIARSAGAAARRADGTTVTLLVVESDPRARHRIERAAVRWALPLRLLWADDAFDALVAQERYRPDILLTDLHATPMDGFAFLRRLRTIDAYRSTALVVATALDDADLVEHGGLPPGTVRWNAPVPLDILRGFVEACALTKALTAR